MILLRIKVFFVVLANVTASDTSTTNNSKQEIYFCCFRCVGSIDATKNQSYIFDVLDTSVERRYLKM